MSKGDDTIALQALIDAAGDTSTYRSSGVITLEPRTYRISDTIRVTRRSVILRGSGVAPTDNGGTTLLWAGLAGKPMLQLNQSMHSRIQDIRFGGNSLAKPSAAISFLQTGRDVCPNEGNILSNLWIGPMLGWDLDEAQQFDNGIIFEGVNLNNDFTTVENLTIYYCNVGINVGGSQACGQDFRNIRIYQCPTGVIDYSTNTYNNIYLGNCDVNFSIRGGGSMTLVAVKSEEGGRFVTFDSQGGYLSVYGGGFQCGKKMAKDGRVIDGYTPNPVSVMLSDFTFAKLDQSLCPVVRLRSDPAGSEGRKTFLGYNLANFGPENLDMDVSGPAAVYPDGQRYIEFNVRGMHANPLTSKKAGFFRNLVEAGGKVDLSRYDMPVSCNLMPHQPDVTGGMIGPGKPKG
jgi:hypothetical protein